MSFCQTSQYVKNFNLEGHPAGLDGPLQDDVQLELVRGQLRGGQPAVSQTVSDYLFSHVAARMKGAGPTMRHFAAVLLALMKVRGEPLEDGKTWIKKCRASRSKVAPSQGSPEVAPVPFAQGSGRVEEALRGHRGVEGQRVGPQHIFFRLILASILMDLQGVACPDRGPLPVRLGAGEEAHQPECKPSYAGPRLKKLKS